MLRKRPLLLCVALKQTMATVGELKARGYKEGSIVRVHMHNFISYDDAVVYPGPKLNIILGPNGIPLLSISFSLIPWT
jgi:hypothetical protein